MHYLIDGYNLLHHAGRLLGKRHANLEAARLDLLRLLHGRFGKSADRITAVFDARRAPGNVPDAEDYFGIEVRFTRFEEADDLIESIIRKVSNPQQLSIVSNDRRIKEAARRRSCAVVECVEFWELLLARPKDEPKRAVPESERPAMTSQEIDDWVKEFGDLEADPGYRELFGDMTDDWPGEGQ